MPFTRRALGSVWLILFGLFAVSGSGRIVGPGVLLLVLGSLVAPAIMLTVGA